MTNYISKKITVVGFVLSLMIVFYHTINYTIYTCLELTMVGRFWMNFQKFLEILFFIPVPLFFVISGYLFYRNYSYAIMTVKWRSRIFSLAIPYLIWNIISFVCYYAMTNIPVIANHLNKEQIHFNLQTLFEVLNSKYTVLWFVRDLMFFVLFSPVIYSCVKNKYTWGY